MASTFRYVDTRFWVDGWVRSLNSLDRYVFLYFLTNDHSSWCGVYELPISTISFETGITEEDLVKSILPRLSPKIIFIDGWIHIKNFQKYHSNSSEKTQKGILDAWKSVPDRIRLKIKEISGDEIPHTRGIQGVCPLTSTSTSNNDFSKEKSLLGKKITYVVTNNDGEEIEIKPRKKPEPRDPNSYHITISCAEIIYKQCGTKPVIALKEIAAIKNALKQIPEKDIYLMVEDACNNGFAQEKNLSLNAILSNIQINKFKLNYA